jgi:uncharacterized protein YbjT (DUF2867 family)
MIVVTGATGNVGRPLVKALAAVEPVTAVSRRIAAADVPEGVRHRQSDLAQLESLKSVLDGAQALFLLLSAELLARLASPDEILEVVRAAGVRRVVLLSSQAAATRPTAPGYALFRAFEAAVQQSGLGWTILRPAGFDSNALAWAESVRSQRTIAAPFADVGLPTIDPTDVAEVAAIVLRDETHAGRAYELTGPVGISPRRQACAIEDVLGEPVRFVEQSRDEARTQMLRLMPEPIVDSTLDVLGEPSPAERQVRHDVRQLLGRAPHSFAEWASRNVDAFR